MDLDAEMAKLQEEARRRLAREGQDREAEEEELPRQTFDPELLKQKETEEEETKAGLALSTKLILVIVAVILGAVLWDPLIVPLLKVVIAAAIVLLTLLGVWKLVELRGKKKPE